MDWVAEMRGLRRCQGRSGSQMERSRRGLSLLARGPMSLDLRGGDYPHNMSQSQEFWLLAELFYVSLTQARDEILMLYSGFVDTPRGRMRWGRSPFLNELEARMQEAEGS